MRISTALAFYGGLLAALATAHAMPMPGSRSGLPWTSGAVVSPSSTVPDFDAWRGRPIDARNVFLGISTWQHMISSAPGIRWHLATGSRLIVAIGMLPRDHAGQLAQCASGQFDAQIRALTRSMLNSGALAAYSAGKPVIIRLGWEANNTKGSFPWRATGNGASWRNCFKRWVSILNPLIDHDANPATPKQRQRRFLVTWNMANKGTFNYPIDNLWPGNDFVDIVGSEFYDRCPPLPAFSAGWSIQDPEWNARINARASNGNPAGPGAWLAYARSKGKPYAIPEWGVGGPSYICPRPGVDNPYFIQRLYQFLWVNSASIAFESVFNAHGAPTDTGGSHKLFAADPLYPSADDPDFLTYATRYLPNSAATYRQLWGRGETPPLP